MKRMSTSQHVQPVVNQCSFTKYAVEILRRFDMLDCKSMVTPMDTNMKFLSDESSWLVDMTQYRKIIGSLIYMMNTRPDICFDVNILSQFLVKPRCLHLIATNHMMRYLKGMIYFGIYYVRDHDYILCGYIDSY